MSNPKYVQKLWKFVKTGVAKNVPMRVHRPSLRIVQLVPDSSSGAMRLAEVTLAVGFIQHLDAAKIEKLLSDLYTLPLVEYRTNRNAQRF